MNNTLCNGVPCSINFSKLEGKLLSNLSPSAVVLHVKKYAC